MSPYLAAAVQMTSTDDVAANIAAAETLVTQAVEQGAQLIALPENAFYFRREGTAMHPDGPMLAHPGVQAMQQLAKRHGVWILIGSIRAREGGMDKPFNRAVLIADSGEVAAVYDKLHLFDVTFASGHRYAESSQAVAGEEPVVAATPLGHIGLSICYDIRFPALYRAMALAGAEILTVPAAFTRQTGEAHWRALLIARAIENGAYVIAPGQCGEHPGGRETYGHSLIIGPWGEVLAEADATTPGVITARIDPARAAEIRAQLPVLTHHRDLPPVRVVSAD